MEYIIVKLDTYPGDRLNNVINEAKNIVNDKNNVIDVVSFDFNGVTMFIDDTISDNDIELYYNYCSCFDKNANDYESFILKSSLIFADRKKSLVEIEEEYERHKKELKNKLFKKAFK